MNWSTWIRQTHRWLSIAFTLGVITYIIVMNQGQPAVWVGLLALVPLVLLLCTGLYLFLLPHAIKRRSGRRTAQVGG
jgi:hypothetical protein